MTEYDFSQEAYDRYMSTQQRVGRWAQEASSLGIHGDPPPTPPMGNEQFDERGRRVHRRHSGRHPRDGHYYSRPMHMHGNHPGAYGHPQHPHQHPHARQHQHQHGGHRRHRSDLPPTPADYNDMPGMPGGLPGPMPTPMTPSQSGAGPNPTGSSRPHTPHPHGPGMPGTQMPHLNSPRVPGAMPPSMPVPIQMSRPGSTMGGPHPPNPPPPGAVPITLSRAPSMARSASGAIPIRPMPAGGGGPQMMQNPGMFAVTRYSGPDEDTDRRRSRGRGRGRRSRDRDDSRSVSRSYSSSSCSTCSGSHPSNSYSTSSGYHRHRHHGHGRDHYRDQQYPQDGYYEYHGGNGRYEMVRPSVQGPTFIQPSATHPIVVPINGGQGGYVVVPAQGHTLKVVDPGNSAASTKSKTSGSSSSSSNGPFSFFEKLFNPSSNPKPKSRSRSRSKSRTGMKKRLGFGFGFGRSRSGEMSVVGGPEPIIIGAPGHGHGMGGYDVYGDGMHTPVGGYDYDYDYEHDPRHGYGHGHDPMMRPYGGPGPGVMQTPTSMRGHGTVPGEYVQSNPGMGRAMSMGGQSMGGGMAMGGGMGMGVPTQMSMGGHGHGVPMSSMGPGPMPVYA